MIDSTEAYFIARVLVAKELTKKYNQIQSYKDDNLLTHNGKNYSLHFNFYIPYGVDIFLIPKGSLTSWHTSFISYF